MNALRFRSSRGIAALALGLLLAAPATAEDLLYASDGKQLFTIDIQTGEATFISDGPLQWIASPAFDEEHHTRLWVSGFPRQDPFRGPFWVAQDGVQFSWGNPFTGDSGGPYPATISFDNPAGLLIRFDSMAVYAPTTQRLYVLGMEDGGGPGPSHVPIMIDPYNGPTVPDWGSESGGGFWDVEFTSALAFDRTTGLILQAYDGSSDGGNAWGYGVRTLDPVTGLFRGEYFSSPYPCFPCERGAIDAMAVEPATGDMYYLHAERYTWFDNPTTTTLFRRERTTGQKTAIANIPSAAWSLNFADARYAQ